MALDPGSIWSGDALGMAAVGAAIGAVGGLARFARNVWGSPTGDTVPRVLISSVFVGAVAAVAMLYALDPQTGLKFVAACIVGGYAGPTLLDVLEARFKLLVAENKAAMAVDVGDKAVATATKAIKEAKSVAEAAPTPKGAAAFDTSKLDAALDDLAVLNKELLAVKKVPLKR